MKKTLLVVLALGVSASMACAGAISENDQFQGQFDGGLSGVVPGVAAGQISGAGAGQIGYGYVFSDPGDVGSENQNQSQIQIDGIVSDDGNGTFAGAAWATVQNQQQSSDTQGGFAGSAQAQGLIAGSAGLTVGGVAGVAGSAGAAGSLGGSLALGGDTQASQGQAYQGIYVQQSVSPNGGYIAQAGGQLVATGTETSAGGAGLAVAGAGVYQYGGTVAGNDGTGTGMEGHASAQGEAEAFAFEAGGANAAAGALGVQVHRYEQYNVSADGTSQQFQTGAVSTVVSATAQ